MNDIGMWALLLIAFCAGVTVGLGVMAITEQREDEDGIDEWQRFRDSWEPE